MRLGETRSQSPCGKPGERLRPGHKLKHSRAASQAAPVLQAGGFTPDARVCCHRLRAPIEKLQSGVLRDGQGAADSHCGLSDRKQNLPWGYLREACRG